MAERVRGRGVHGGHAVPLDRIDDPTRLRQELEGFVDTWTGIVRYLGISTPDATEPELPLPRYGEPRTCPEVTCGLCDPNVLRISCWGDRPFHGDGLDRHSVGHCDGDPIDLVEAE